MENWKKIIFEKNSEAEVGSRLGVSFLQAEKESIPTMINGENIEFKQSSAGLLAISGVIWDAALLLIDFLSMGSDLLQCEDIFLGNVLDIGTGTGIVGISCLKLGAKHVVFTDCNEIHVFNENVESIIQRSVEFIKYNWESDDIPKGLLSPNSSDTLDNKWDVVTCSDLLYESKYHRSLLNLMKKIPFKVAIFSYKKRHDEKEEAFFDALNAFCEIRVVDNTRINLVNAQPSALSGLYLLLAFKKDPIL